MNKTLLSLIIASTVTMTGCKEELSTSGNSSLKPAVVTKENAVASVNGEYISKASLETLEKEIAQRSQGQPVPKDKLIDELIHRELLVQDATQKKLDQTPEYTEQLATIQKSLMSQAAVQNYIKSNPLTDAELKAEYDKNVAKSGDEYKASHIIVKTEDEAKKVIAELKKGADFAKLAKKKSTGPSGPKGGDLGWFASGQMVPPFSEAVIALEDNKFTTEPVKTQFGYHVILREGSRVQKAPPFDTVKEQLRPMLQREKIQTFLTTLRGQAQVEVIDAAAPAVAPAAGLPGAGEVATNSGNAASGVADAASETAEKATSGAADAVSDTAKKATEIVKEKVTDAIAK